jgi:hypothetical protein
MEPGDVRDRRRNHRHDPDRHAPWDILRRLRANQTPS